MKPNDQIIIGGFLLSIVTNWFTFFLFLFFVHVQQVSSIWSSENKEISSKYPSKISNMKPHLMLNIFQPKMSGGIYHFQKCGGPIKNSLNTMTSYQSREGAPPSTHICPSMACSYVTTRWWLPGFPCSTQTNNCVKIKELERSLDKRQGWILLK